MLLWFKLRLVSRSVHPPVAAAASMCLALAGFSGPADAWEPAAVEALQARRSELAAPRSHHRSRFRAHRRARRTAHHRSRQFRTIDGSHNNRDLPDLNATDTPLRRLTPADYADGVSALAGADRPGARAVSNAVSWQEHLEPNDGYASDFLWQWGQFLDHDIDLTEGADPPEAANIAVPTGDPFFDPNATGVMEIALNRSVYDPESGLGQGDPRQQLNQITGWIDASNVYGSSEQRAHALRTNDGTGRLRTSAGDLLPWNTDGLPNAGGTSASLFLAGDVRANEQVGLTAMHTLFVREHNRLARRLAHRHPGWTGNRVYERARQMVGAQMQVITYREFLPTLLGPGALRPYSGYDPDADASISNEFSTAAYRFGHSALSTYLKRIDAQGDEIAHGHLPLRDAFFDPSRITDEGGIEPLLRGLASQRCQKVDVMVVDDVRNFLFGAPGQGGFDLASLNIQRGRDHGLASYNDVREALGLPRADGFADISSDSDLQARLASVYADVDALDLWTGGLAEDRLAHSHLGETFQRIVARQFELLRDGDRFFYESAFRGRVLRWLERTRLSDIIRRNTDIGEELPDDVFRVGDGF